MFESGEMTIPGTEADTVLGTLFWMIRVMSAQGLLCVENCGTVSTSISHWSWSRRRSDHDNVGSRIADIDIGHFAWSIFYCLEKVL